jgi:acetyl esterase/lipase
MLKVDPHNMAIGGVSAGAHLTAILAQRSHALNIPLKLQILTVPATDLTALSADWSLPPSCPYPSYHENAQAPCLPLERVQYFLKYLLGPKMPDPVPAANPAILPPEVELSPIKAAALAGLAPAMVSTAEVDMLRDDGEEYARRLQAEGVRVRVKRFRGVPHPFTFMDQALPEAREYIQDCCDALKLVFDRKEF